MSQTFSIDGTTAINTVLAEEANRIGNDIHKQTLHTSPWIDLIKKSTFPDQSGGFLTTLVYDRAIPVSTGNGSSAAGQPGADWLAVAASEGSGTLGTSTLGQPMPSGDTMETEIAPNKEEAKSFVHFGKKLKQYELKRAALESPRITLDDMRFAAHRTEQLRAIMDLLTEATRYTWENRYRDEYARLSDSYVGCVASGSAIQSGFEGDAIDAMLDLGTAGSFTVPTANISNAILDKCYYNLIRKGAGNNAYGRENGRPVFALICSSEASYQLQTEAGFRDDVRYNNAKVSDLIAPLGIEKSFRGFYHLIDDLAPRFDLDNTDQITRHLPYEVASGLTTYNTSYEDASYEAAFIVHPEMMESQIPAPLGSVGSGVTFNAQDYKGDFKWLNIAHATNNPDSNTGFFRGVLASASKPIKTDFGFMILFKRDSSTPAA
tara:strand:+ start:102 stop:1403 length:1302 start_codon:yes stop_codon:yes gene_type:complete